jgi:signal transduction histidine kinase
MMNFRSSSGDDLRGINLKVTLQDTDYILQVAYASEKLIQERNRQFIFLLMIIPLTILVTFFTSIHVAGQALSPIRQTIQRVQDMVKTENYLPLPIPQTHDEIAELSLSYNELLLKIKHTLEAQDQFVAHASHQLKTPLAIMRGELEVFQSKPRSSEELDRFHHSLLQELHRLTELVRDMLLISRVEAGREHFNFSALALDEIVTETVARLSLKARDKNVSLKFNFDSIDNENSDNFKIYGERQLLTCLTENIIENAIKYSPGHSSVQVTLKGGSYPSLVINDEGPGIPQNVLERLKNEERFFRGSHSDSLSGSGLGLYLVKKIADYHRAKVIIEKRIPSPGTRLVVEFG